MTLDVKHLRYFVAVAEDHSFTRAAERLNVVQQTLSTAIQHLERELGVQLLVRTTRKVELTEAGRALLDSGREAIAAVDRAWASASPPADHRPPVLVGYTATLESWTVPALHAAATERLSDADVQWSQDWSSAVVEGVAARRYDVGLARHAERRSSLAYATVGQEPQGVVVAAGHRFAAASAVPLAELRGHRVLAFSRELAPGYHDALIESCRAAGFEPQLMLPPDTGAAGVKMSLLEGGEVVAVAPVAAGRRYVDIASGRLAFVPLADPAPSLPIDLLWHPSAVQRREVAAFVDLVREVGAAGALVPRPAGIH